MHLQSSDLFPHQDAPHSPQQHSPPVIKQYSVKKLQSLGELLFVDIVMAHIKKKKKQLTDSKYQ